MKITILTSLLTIAGLNLANAQSEANDNIHKQNFYGEQVEYLMKKEGTWVAQNSKYIKDEKYSAKEYKYIITKGIHAEQIKIEILSNLNDVGWYLSWDGYFLWNPLEKEIKYKSVAGNGSIGEGTVYAPESDILVNVFKVTEYEGKVSWHKDVFIFKNDNELVSKAYALDERGDWVAREEMTWKRMSN